jgi:hypothetical protein
LVPVELRCQRGEQRVSESVRVWEPDIDEKAVDMKPPEAVGPSGEPRIAAFSAERQVQVLVEELDHCGIEGSKPLAGWRARPEWRWPTDQLLLESAFVFVE